MYRRVLTMQDISCVGQCSTTVALPILSACGLEACILPTALLSTHTGGFGKPAVGHFDGALTDIWHHWQENGITFDAILVGYLGSLEAVKAAGEIIDRLLAPGGVAIVDPAMADNGKLYSGFDEDYVRAIGSLAGKADIILPNVTEAAIFAASSRFFPCISAPVKTAAKISPVPWQPVPIRLWRYSCCTVPSCRTMPVLSSSKSTPVSTAQG